MSVTDEAIIKRDRSLAGFQHCLFLLQLHFAETSQRMKRDAFLEQIAIFQLSFAKGPLISTENFSSDLTRLPGSGRTLSKIRFPSGFATG